MFKHHSYHSLLRVRQTCYSNV